MNTKILLAAAIALAIAVQGIHARSVELRPTEDKDTNDRPALTDYQLSLLLEFNDTRMLEHVMRGWDDVVQGWWMLKWVKRNRQAYLDFKTICHPYHCEKFMQRMPQQAGAPAIPPAVTICPAGLWYDTKKEVCEYSREISCSPKGIRP